MAKAPDAFRTISEVADWLDTPAHVLRFWESKFVQIKPVKRAGGRRYYRPEDMALLGGIKALLHEQGLTIKGVQKILREKGVRHVAALGPQPAEGMDWQDEAAGAAPVAVADPPVAPPEAVAVMSVEPAPDLPAPEGMAEVAAQQVAGSAADVADAPAQTMGDLTPAMADADQPLPVQETIEPAEVITGHADQPPLAEDLPALAAVAPDADAVADGGAETVDPMAEPAEVAADGPSPAVPKLRIVSVGGAATPLPAPVPLPEPAGPVPAPPRARVLSALVMTDARTLRPKSRQLAPIAARLQALAARMAAR
jgi:resuscitation-promoting factor RpfA